MLALARARLDVPTFAVQLKPVGLTDNMEVATGVGPAIPEPYIDVQAPAEQTAPVVHLGEGKSGS